MERNKRNKEKYSGVWRRICKRSRRVLYGEVCISCGDRGVRDELLCPSCATKFQRKLAEKCPDCGAPRMYCYCAPPQLTDAGCEFLAKLAAYRHGDGDCPLNRIIWRQKRVRDRECAAFLAGLMADPITAMLDGQGVDRRELIVTYVPRDPVRVLDAGHDQAKMLAGAVARELDVPCLTLLDRRRGSSEQKQLSADERVKNVRQLFSLAAVTRNGGVAGRTVLLIDDLVTTGATAAACVSLLSGAGARVYCASVAFTPLLRSGEQETASVTGGISASRR